MVKKVDVFMCLQMRKKVELGESKTNKKRINKEKM